MKRKKPATKLRKQPRARRLQTAAPVYNGDVPVPRTARRRRRRNQRAVKRALAVARLVLFSARWISLLIFLMCAFALALIGQDPGFVLREIPVEGAYYLTPVEVINASELAGIHVFAANPEAAAARVDALPGVVAARVTLQWPNQVAIQIEEDTPIAIWEQGGQEYWINERGQLIPARSHVPGLLRIQAEEAAFTTLDPDGEEIEPSEVETRLPIPFVPAPVLDGALQLRALRPNIDALYYRPAGGLSYQDGRGWRAYFGVGLDMDQKLTVYEYLVDHLLERQLAPEYISVSNQGKPFYLARGG